MLPSGVGWIIHIPGSFTKAEIQRGNDDHKHIQPEPSKSATHRSKLTGTSEKPNVCSGSLTVYGDRAKRTETEQESGNHGQYRREEKYRYGFTGTDRHVSIQHERNNEREDTEHEQCFDNSTHETAGAMEPQVQGGEYVRRVRRDLRESITDKCTASGEQESHEEGADACSADCNRGNLYATNQAKDFVNDACGNADDCG